MRWTFRSELTAPGRLARSGWFVPFCRVFCMRIALPPVAVSDARRESLMREREKRRARRRVNAPRDARKRVPLPDCDLWGHGEGRAVDLRELSCPVDRASGAGTGVALYVFSHDGAAIGRCRVLFGEARSRTVFHIRRAAASLPAPSGDLRP